jgi:uncharacterized protein (DUF305 family)
MNIKLIAGLTAGTLALGTVVALAQMQHGEGMMGQGMMGQGMHGRMNHAQMQHGPGMHHGPMHKSEKHGGGAQHGKPKGDTGPSSLAFHAINAKMHDGMDIAFTGNADIDFVRGMIPHHQGAVDMAKTVIAFGKDPQIRKLAEEVVKAQESEIALMQDWLKQNGQ